MAKFPSCTEAPGWNRGPRNTHLPALTRGGGRGFYVPASHEGSYHLPAQEINDPARHGDPCDAARRSTPCTAEDPLSGRPDDPVHPLYLKAKEDARWKGVLPALWSVLNHEADDELERWHWRILQNGIVVAIKRRKEPVARYDLRLARREAKGFRESDDKWRRDVAVVLAALCITPVAGKQVSATPGAYWLKGFDTHEKGRRVAFYTSLLSGEVRPGRALCAKCEGDVEVDWFAGGGVKGQRCTDHAMTTRG